MGWPPAVRCPARGLVGFLLVLSLALLVEYAASQAPCIDQRICQGNFDLSLDDPGLCTVINGTVTVSKELVFSANCVSDITQSLLIESNVEIGSLQGFEVR
eukprot:5198209-Pyramimonas_sp.AAC.5